MTSFGYKRFKYLSALIFGFLSWFRAQVGKNWGEIKYIFNKPDQLLLTLELKRMTDVTTR